MSTNEGPLSKLMRGLGVKDELAPIPTVKPITERPVSVMSFSEHGHSTLAEIDDSIPIRRLFEALAAGGFVIRNKGRSLYITAPEVTREQWRKEDEQRIARMLDNGID